MKKQIVFILGMIICAFPAEAKDTCFAKENSWEHFSIVMESPTADAGHITFEGKKITPALWNDLGDGGYGMIAAYPAEGKYRILIINCKGDTVIGDKEHRFTNATFLSPKRIALKNQWGKWASYDETGKKITKFQWTNDYWWNEQGKLAFLERAKFGVEDDYFFTVNDRKDGYYIINREGERVTKKHFTYMSEVSDYCLFYAETKKGCATYSLSSDCWEIKLSDLPFRRPKFSKMDSRHITLKSFHGPYIILPTEEGHYTVFDLVGEAVKKFNATFIYSIFEKDGDIHVRTGSGGHKGFVLSH